MPIHPKPFHELLKLKFTIPPYQRGYRWDKEQVGALLDDLMDFIRQYVRNNATSSPQKDIYYCLQSITVVPDKNDSEHFFVVDGQQRLTTIYILLHFLRNKEEWNYPIYTLSMPKRDVQHTYINELDFKDPNKNYADNIDNFYVHEAYQTIKEWFANDSRRGQFRNDFRNLFAYEPEKNEQNRDVRVLWYVITGASAMDAFRRMNYGKIPLTSTEIVKALLLQGGESMAGGTHSRGAAYRRALEWDSMEHDLHNPYLWSMLSGESSNSLSRLNIILDFVADNINDEMKDPKTGLAPFSRKDKSLFDSRNIHDYFNYHVINEYLRSKGIDGIEDVWSRIRSTFNLITNWYANRLWYHLIGLLRILPTQRKAGRDFVKTLYEKSVNSEGKAIERPAFTERLIKMIGKEVRLPVNLSIDTLSYNENKHKPHIIKILKLLNVKESIDDPTDLNRFAFHLFEDYNVTSLEHIHPQNITTDASYEDFSRWVNRRISDFEKLSDSDFIGLIKADYPDVDLEELKRMASERKFELMEAATKLRHLTSDPKIYRDEENQESLQTATRILDSIFGELAGITESELHSISNLALVDQPTNSALQNYFLDHKRDILMNRHKLNVTNSHEGTYAPPATRRVFSKDYSRKDPGDMRLWRKEDRQNYLKAIYNAYNFFVNTLNDER